MDYSKFGLGTGPANPDPLRNLGWRNDFARQVFEDEANATRPARVYIPFQTK